ncbi:MAG: SpoIIIAH-like family protein [Candidatus Carbobacillus altaicus]|uniref:Stage III sporulation protein AH n=1 Tax=Candidatus Carbonibacillus altaicus TaxID=2163959 RepID=A0A2R6Y393_9BACL|nr:SpoIIIAH-like family protein [Candidatus Carbobacillus altaicus]PTQ57156.1 MAG: Stage III sporulation protein AH [Candidatus Carbobacillus altaicus]
MSAKKQTMWLLSMLTLLVVLSVYYLFYTDPQGSNHALTDDGADMDQTDANGQTEREDSVVTVRESDDFFASARLMRDQQRAKAMEEYFALIDNGGEGTVKEASAKIDALQNAESRELMVESLLKASGFQDAVVMENDGKVSVVVRASDLKNEDVVGIIQTVSKNMNVSGTAVTVSYRP